MIARQQRCGQIPREDEDGWVELLSSYYEGSPAVRDQFNRFQRGYQPGVRRLLGVDLHKESSLSGNGAFEDFDGYGSLLG
jgi:hypothetical protein